MIIVKYSNPSATIKVQITINGIDLWHYHYQADEPYYNSSKLLKSPEHELGIAKNLEKDTHFWKITLGNPTANDKRAEVNITWLENGKKIATWIPKQAGDDKKVLVKANDGIELTDSAFFIPA